MSLGMNLLKKTKDEYLKEIANLVRDEKTLIFFDTNILAYLYKLHGAARNEFFIWTDSILTEERLCIPAWSANEYLSRVTSKQLQAYTPKSKEPDQIKKALEAMLGAASLFVDTTLLSKISFVGDRAKYLSDFEKAINALPQFTCAFKQEFDPEIVHDEIQSHLATAVLKSDISQLCVRASREGDNRFEHRLPPGFKDGKKDENRFGDLIIWFEILEHSSTVREKFSNVVFISNDEKCDWVYAPKRREEILGAARKAIANTKPELKIIDPRLKSEFDRVVGHDNIFICTLFDLIEGLSIENADNFGQLAQAIQINIEERSETEIVGAPVSESVVNLVAAECPIHATSEMQATAQIIRTEHCTGKMSSDPSILCYGQNAISDSEYAVEAPSVVNEIIRDLKSHNWYVQNPAIVKIYSIGDQEVDPDSWFVLGRNIYQAACGNAGKAMDFIANLGVNLSRLPSSSANHILAGIVFEIYFDSFGQFRKEPKAYLIETPLQQIAESQFEDVKNFILIALEPFLADLQFKPGDSQKVHLRIESLNIPTPGSTEETNRYHVISVQFEGKELLSNRDEDAWTYSITDSFTIKTLVEYLSKNLAIPRWAIERHFEPGVRLDAIFFMSDDKMIDFHLASANENISTIES
ncbi:PIN-like domain-containing protein [Undibacterium sp. Di24W]|uniref:PIN-like domain-containing protein n=1 Tax=Undibacterium sp. Di24W TaxID=3413033 RepID=UPI003BF01091